MKVEFKRRLIKLRDSIDRAIKYDSFEVGLMPALWSVISYLWSLRLKDGLKDYCARCRSCHCSTCKYRYNYEK